MSILNFIITLLLLILLLGVIIFIHEFGHFLAAKKAGVYVDEFSLGMGPLLWKYKPKKSETTYSLRAFPIGGYVSMAEKESKEIKVKKDRVLANKSFLRVLSVLIMGIVFNFILSIVVFFISGLIYGEPVSEPIIGSIQENSPAYEVGLEKGDKIISVNGKDMNTWEEVLIEITAKKLQKFYVLEVVKTDGSIVKYKLSPDVTKDEEGNEKRTFGIGTSLAVYNKGFIPAVRYAFTGFYNNFTTIFDILGSLFTGDVPVSSLSGPVGIYGIVDQVKDTGLESLLYLLAYLSINVGIVNLIPIPVFDGGRVLLLIIEKITKKKTSDKVEAIINYVGFGLMILLMLYVTFNDILKLF